MPAAENALPGATNDSWRAWLSTGTRRAAVDRRRLRGANKGLKRMLVEGMTSGDDRPHAWNDFSGAMIRHAVDEAMRSLPLEDKQVVKLAYFGGFSNREIAHQVGLTEAAVQRRLRRSLAAISEHVQHGRAVARKAVYALLVWLGGRWLHDLPHHLAEATVVASVTVIAVAQPAPPAIATAPITGVEAGSSPAARIAPVVPPLPSPTAPAQQTKVAAAEGHPAQPAGAARAPLPPVQAPLRLPLNVPAPPPVPLPIKRHLL